MATTNNKLASKQVQQRPWKIKLEMAEETNTTIQIIQIQNDGGNEHLFGGWHVRCLRSFQTLMSACRLRVRMVAPVETWWMATIAPVCQSSTLVSIARPVSGIHSA